MDIVAAPGGQGDLSTDNMALVQLDHDQRPTQLPYHHHGGHHHQQPHHQQRGPGLRSCDDSYEVVMLVLTLPLWTFLTLFLLLLLVHYLRRLQSFSLYDRCVAKNAHFRYDFHLVVGKHSANYSRLDSQLILDLLDDQLVSTITIQIPGTTIFNDNLLFAYKHSRPNLRCVNFTIYRKHPFKDVRAIRVAHNCANQDSRIYVYGLNLYDATNTENRFFPVTSLVKYRGTQWALVTTFEPRPDGSFKRLGVDCYDPMGYTTWPTHAEMLAVVFYIWCGSFCFGHLISIGDMIASIPLHSLTITVIVGVSAAILAVLYLKLIKRHMVDQHFEATWWWVLQMMFLAAVVFLSSGFWFLSTKQATRCREATYQWIISTVSCSIILTCTFLFVYFAIWLKKQRDDRYVMIETDNQLAKTSSKQNQEYAVDPMSNLWCWRGAAPYNPALKQSSKTLASKLAKSHVQKTPLNKAPSESTAKKIRGKVAEGAKNVPENSRDETLDNAFGPSEGSNRYIKTRNRNSISQYV